MLRARKHPDTDGGISSSPQTVLGPERRAPLHDKFPLTQNQCRLERLLRLRSLANRTGVSVDRCQRSDTVSAACFNQRTVVMDGGVARILG